MGASAITNSLIEEFDEGEKTDISMSEMAMGDPAIPMQPISSVVIRVDQQEERANILMIEMAMDDPTIPT